MDLLTFNQSVESAIRRKDGVALREALRLRSIDATKAMEVYISDGGNLPAAMEEPWEVLPEIVGRRFAAGAALNSNDWMGCCDHVSDMLTAYLNSLSLDSGWSLPLLHALCSDLRIVAEQADAQLKAQGRKPFKLSEVERVLKRGFTVTNNDRRTMEEDSKRAGTLGVINQLLRVYFRLNNLRLCGNLTRTVMAKNFPPFEDYPVHDRVTYKFYSGRLHLYDDRVEQAVEDLTYAFKALPQSRFDHRRAVLMYLIPAKILMGSLPKADEIVDGKIQKEGMITKFNMKWYEGIVRGIREGRLDYFDSAVDEHEEVFIGKALFLSVEKMRMLVYRSLIRKMFNAFGLKIVLDKIVEALAKFCHKEVSRDELECILANMIFRGYIKGYISHKVGYLVLSKKNAFPPVPF